MSPALKASSVWAFSCGAIDDVAAALGVGLEPCSFSQARSATSWVLPSSGWRSSCPSGPRRRDVGLDDQEAPPEVAPETIRMASPSDLCEGVDGRVRADVGGVDGAGEERLDGLGAGVERLRSRACVGAEGFGEDALLDADDGRWRG